MPLSSISDLNGWWRRLGAGSANCRPLFLGEFMELKLSKDKSRLLEKPKEWDFGNPPLKDTEELSKAMVKFVYDNNAYGVAYPQLDLPGNYRVFAMRGFSKEDFVCFNPRIVNFSDELVQANEGCLSYPGLILSIKRPKGCRVRFEGPDGQTYTKQFEGMNARTFMHETDHCNGRVFWYNVSKLKFDIAVKKAKKNGFDYSGLLYLQGH